MESLSFHVFLSLCLTALAFTFAASDDQFVYSGFTGSNLILDGTAMVSGSGLLELNNGTGNLKGHAFYPTPLQFHNFDSGVVQSFSVRFVFAIISVYPDLSGHGIAFFVSPSKNFSSAFAAQYLGLTNNLNNGKTNNHLFAVELDTIQSIEFHDINANHVGINVNGLHSVESAYAGYYDDQNGSFQNLTLMSRHEMQVWIEYDGQATQINVTIAPLKMEKPVRPLVSVRCNLSKVLTNTAYIGFSSAVGPVDSRHYILAWSFGINKPAPAIDMTKLPKLPYVGPVKPSKVFEIILPLGVAACVFIIGTFIILLRSRRLRYAELHEDWEDEFRPHRFSYKDLFHATEGFKNKNLLGVGGFGKVYKGILSKSKLKVAVKRIHHESRQGIKEFIAEIVSIGRLRHRNLVQLLGYCRRKGELLLVYDYMSNGSLDNYLYSRLDKPALTWAQRFSIIKGIGCGLLYLHEKWEKVVVHRDIKASNVLLDSEMNGRIGDFGLARLYDHGTDPQTTHVVGTMGYLAPELIRTGKASPLTDVFAFGIFLLEITCGQRAIKLNGEDNQGLLVDWVLEHLQSGSVGDTVDPNLQGNYNMDEVLLVLKLGLMCSHPFTSARPSMRHVMQYLDGDMPVPELEPAHLGFNMLALMQNEGFDPSIMTYAHFMTSFGTMSSLSGGRFFVCKGYSKKCTFTLMSHILHTRRVV